MAIALPGQRLGTTATHLSGPGTHTDPSGAIIASLAGPIQTTTAGGRGANTSSIADKPTLSIPHPPPNPTAHNGASTTVLPRVGDEVLARVTRLQARQATVEMGVGGDDSGGAFVGIVRAQDVRATEKDKVKVGECFRVGDVIRAVVISLGDQTGYYLSTATNHLGVVMATSEDGNQMYPISWKEFRDPKTGRTESRKVAKPF
ncbi:hypothetical protein BDY21DRAFT_403909 [Lineolata rhizophorae]|uniref:Exosome component EXOSC1/CSL4-domain-containing protein n=1 Tax=Lineolata rhizophorae TaxID=578093 RepID=A0A6A6NNF2_9PEZI|nr:hypothetical protein BDY21DRAFT_403909 [Lineolata rhizophorae]